MVGLRGLRNLRWVIDRSVLFPREGGIAWLLAECKVCICLLQPWLRCLALATQGKQTLSTPPVLLLQRFQCRELGSRTTGGEKEKNIWFTYCVTPWGLEGPCPQKLSPLIQPTWLSEHRCHSITAFSESWVALRCEAKGLIIPAAAA